MTYLISLISTKLQQIKPRKYLQILSDPCVLSLVSPGAPCLCPDGNHMPFLFPSATVFLSVRFSGRPWQGRSSTNSPHSLKPKIFMSRGTGKKCLLTFSRNVLCNLLGCEGSFLRLPVEITFTPWTFMNAFTDCEQRCRFGQCFCLLRGKRSPAPLLFCGELEVPLCFSTWRQFSGLITGVWWMACRDIQQTLLWYSFRLFGCLKVVVNLSSATERISPRVRE